MEDTTIEDVLKTAEALYVQKDYQKAIQILEKNKDQVGAGIWHYNMGTLNAKLENLPLARYHFLLADKEGFSAKEMISNKDLIESKLEISRYEKPLAPTDYLIKGALFSSQGILTMVSLIFVLFGLYNFWKNKSFKVLAGCLSVGLIVLGLNVWIRSWKKTIVLGPQTIQEGPSVIFGAGEELPAGVMIITRSRGDWLEIMYPSRFKGWIKDNDLKELK